MTDIESFAKDVFIKFNTNIIDAMFVFIQNDKQLMNEYLRLIAENGAHLTNEHELDVRINGRIISELHKLIGTTDAGLDGIQTNATSSLLTTYQKIIEKAK